VHESAAVVPRALEGCREGDEAEGRGRDEDEDDDALSTWNERAWTGERRAAARVATRDERANMVLGAGEGREEDDEPACDFGRTRDEAASLPSLSDSPKVAQTFSLERTDPVRPVKVAHSESGATARLDRPRGSTRLALLSFSSHGIRLG